MRFGNALLLLLVSIALGVALADKNIYESVASPELSDLDTVDTTSGASFSASQEVEKADKLNLAPLSDLKESLKDKTAPPPKDSLKSVLAPPVNAILSALSVPPVDDLLPAISAPPTSEPLTAVSGTPVITPVATPASAKKDLKDIVDKIIVFSPAPPPDSEDKTDKDSKDDILKKPELLKDDKDDKDLEVPVYAYSFASPPKEDLKEDAKDKLKSLLGRRLA